MVNNIHLNRRGLKGDGLAYLFKPEIPQERYGEILAVIVRDQSERLHSESNEIALPSVRETVGFFLFSIIYQLLERDLRSHDDFYANSPIKLQPAVQQTYNFARMPTPPLPHAVYDFIPPKNIF